LSTFSRADLKIINQLLKSGQLCGYWHEFNGGQYLRQFESEFAKFIGVKHAIAVSSGTASIYVALLACGVKRGDYIAVSPYTHIGSVAPMVAIGAKPVFVDVDCFGNLDPKKLHQIRKKLKAVLPVHLLGQPCNMKEILEEDCIVVEDCAQSLGAKYDGKQVGSIGKAGCFSIGGDMTKTLTTGEGGIVTTNDDDVAEYVRNLRNHGETMGADYVCLNMRMSELQGLVGLVQMKRLNFQIDWQIKHAEYLRAKLPNYIKTFKPPKETKPVHYIVYSNFDPKLAGTDRSTFMTRLKEIGGPIGKPRQNISFGIQKLIYQVPFYSRYRTKCPMAEQKTKEALWLDYHRFPRSHKEIDVLLENFRKAVA